MMLIIGLTIFPQVRLNEISNYKQMLVGVSCIYAVSSSTVYLTQNLIRRTKYILKHECREKTYFR